MSFDAPERIYVDARALQDPSFRLRGIGQCAASLIESMRRHHWKGPPPKLIAVVELERDDLLPPHGRLFDEVTAVAKPQPRKPARDTGPDWFLSLSPMTHDSIWPSAFMDDPGLFKIALFYDLIPLEFPGRYLGKIEARISYMIALAWLRRFDAFASISRASADALIDRLAVPRESVFVSGVAVRRTLEPAEDEPPVPHAARATIVVAAGGDWRKNPECALVAHATSALLRDRGFKLTIVGKYSDAMRAKLRETYAKHGGNAVDLSFAADLTDDELHETYRRALVTVVPSRAEGFSIPIVESSAAGTPVLASDIAAHAELVRDPFSRFDGDRPDQLRGLLEDVATHEASWDRMLHSQGSLWREYSVERVGQRFLDGVFARGHGRAVPAPSVRRGARPSIAVLTPLPPAASGVADYTAVTLRPLKALADLHMFVPEHARFEPGWASLSPLSVASAFPPHRFDATLSVIGNSHFHTEILDQLLARGGACIAHDARMLDFYVHVRGMPYALDLASRELKRPVAADEVSHWLNHPRDLPTLFLSEVARAAAPMLVHSHVTAEQIGELYGAQPAVLPFAQYRAIPPDALTPEARSRTRERLGIAHDTCLLVSFGGVGLDRGLGDVLWALKTLRNWSVDARLVLCGTASPHVAAYLRAEAETIGVEDRFTVFEEKVEEDVYAAYLQAADVGIQLRTYFLGGLSGALNDCIAAALPTVANDHLATAMRAPAYVRRVPDNLSSVLIAEAVLDILDKGDNRVRPLAAASTFAQTHSPDAYCRLLMEALGLEVGVRSSIAA